jgi:hypothetical protein
VHAMYSWLYPWLLTWPDLKEKDQEGRTLGRLCELGSFPTVGSVVRLKLDDMDPTCYSAAY